MAKNSFHAYTINQEYVSLAVDHWKIQRRLRRDVDYKFFVHYHPYTEELIEKLNSDDGPYAIYNWELFFSRSSFHCLFNLYKMIVVFLFENLFADQRTDDLPSVLN